jgi:hypothetical protein
MKIPPSETGLVGWGGTSHILLNSLVYSGSWLDVESGHTDRNTDNFYWS